MHLPDRFRLLIRGAAPALALALASLAPGCGTATNENPMDTDSGMTRSGATVESVCVRLLAMRCPGNPTMARCVEEFTALQTACASDRSTFQALLDCGERTTFTCDTDGTPEAVNCQAEARAVLSCGRPRDAGAGD